MRVARAGYPNRVTHSEFLARYHMLATTAVHAARKAVLSRAVGVGSGVSGGGDDSIGNAGGNIELKGDGLVEVCGVLLRSLVPLIRRSSCVQLENIELLFAVEARQLNF